jgi:two-component system sensor histidine kinase DesK
MAAPRDLTRDIHDTVIQPLSSLLMSMTWLECQTSRADQLENALSLWKDLAREALDALRSIMAGYQTSALASSNLPQALQCTLAPQCVLQGLHVHVDSQEWPADLPTGLNFTLYLILREALTNVLRHAQATVARVVLRADSTQLTLSIADDGRGFVQNDLRASQQSLSGGGVGIVSMRERIAQLDGEMELCTAPKRGTQLVFRVPRPGPTTRQTTVRPLSGLDGERASQRRIH